MDTIQIATIIYKPGVRFKDLVHDEEFRVTKKLRTDTFGDSTQLYVGVEPHATRHNKTARVYYRGKWAKIWNGEEWVNPMTLWNSVKRLYPIGSKFKIAHQTIYIRTVSSHEMNKDTFIYSQERLHINLPVTDSEDGSASVYYIGEWAARIDVPIDPSAKVPIKEELTVLPNSNNMFSDVDVNLLEDDEINYI